MNNDNVQCGVLSTTLLRLLGVKTARELIRLLSKHNKGTTVLVHHLEQNPPDAVMELYKQNEGVRHRGRRPVQDRKNLTGSFIVPLHVVLKSLSVQQTRFAEMHGLVDESSHFSGAGRRRRSARRPRAEPPRKTVVEDQLYGEVSDDEDEQADGGANTAARVHFNAVAAFVRQLETELTTHNDATAPLSLVLQDDVAAVNVLATCSGEPAYVDVPPCACTTCIKTRPRDTLRMLLFACTPRTELNSLKPKPKPTQAKRKRDDDDNGATEQRADDAKCPPAKQPRSKVVDLIDNAWLHEVMADNARLVADNAKLAADNAKLTADNAQLRTQNANLQFECEFASSLCALPPHTPTSSGDEALFDSKAGLLPRSPAAFYSRH